MKRTITAPSGARLGGLSVVAGLLLLVACSYAPATTPVPAPATASTQIVLPRIEGGGDGPVDEAPDRTPTDTPAEPTVVATVPATARADISPLSSPTPAEQETPAAAVDAASGGPAPGFTLDNAQGEAVTLSDYQGKSNVVLVFYRGKT